jgi:hypothetical protein
MKSTTPLGESQARSATVGMGGLRVLVASSLAWVDASEHVGGIGENVLVTETRTQLQVQVFAIIHSLILLKSAAISVSR